MDVKQYTCFRFTDSKQKYRPTSWLIRIYLYQTQVLNCRSGQMEKESCMYVNVFILYVFFLYLTLLTMKGVRQKSPFSLPPPRDLLKKILLHLIIFFFSISFYLYWLGLGSLQFSWPSRFHKHCTFSQE